jgi:hypothetical protein
MTRDGLPEKKQAELAKNEPFGIILETAREHRDSGILISAVPLCDRYLFFGASAHICGFFLLTFLIYNVILLCE